MPQNHRGSHSYLPLLLPAALHLDARGQGAGGHKDMGGSCPRTLGFPAWQVSMTTSLTYVFSTQRVLTAFHLALLAHRVSLWAWR